MSHKSFALAAVTALIAGSSAFAGGVDRSQQSIAPLFQDGRYLELSVGHVSPDVSGTGPAGGNTGDMAGNYNILSAAYRSDFNESISYAFLIDQPYGADVQYSTTAPTALAGVSGTVDSVALTGLLQYQINPGFSVYGGLRVQQMSSSVSNPLVSSYQQVSDNDIGYGYVLGAAYEIPAMALRVSLTYHSEISHEFDTVESTAAFGSGRESKTALDTPDALRLDFQTGVAPGTLVFGSIRWSDYSEVVFAPADYALATGGGALLSYDNDAWSYSLGIGRAINENLALSFSIGYEPSTDGTPSYFSPSNGNISYGIGARYTMDNITISGGIRYIDVGDLNFPSPVSSFSGNSAIAAGIQLGIRL